MKIKQYMVLVINNHPSYVNHQVSQRVCGYFEADTADEAKEIAAVQSQSGAGAGQPPHTAVIFHAETMTKVPVPVVEFVEVPK